MKFLNEKIALNCRVAVLERSITKVRGVVAATPPVSTYTLKKQFKNSFKDDFDFEKIIEKIVLKVIKTL